MEPSSDGTALTGLRAALRQRARIIASFVMIPRVEIVELLASVGFDAVVFDFEHGPFTLESLPSLVASARSVGVHSIVRLGEVSQTTIGATLDAGPDGILVAHVSSGREADLAVEAARFPPTGGRSINPFVRGLGYGATDLADLRVADGRTALITMIEGKEGLDAFDQICAVDEIDAMFFGPVDISASLGFPNQPEHPSVVARITKCFTTLAAAERAGAVYAPTADAARRWFDHGARLVAVSADVAMMRRGFMDLRRAVS